MIEKERVPYPKQCNALNNFPYPGMLLFQLEHPDTIELTYSWIAHQLHIGTLLERRHN